MVKKGFDQPFITSVLNAVKHHNFLTKHQMSLEGKVLFDADKLDALNPVRYKRIIAAIKNKQMSKVQTFLMVEAAKLWLRTMRSRYHFPISRELHDKLIAKLVTDREAIEVAKKFGVDIVELVK
jgi:hypothetical protein